MAESKYDKYILKGIVRESKFHITNAKKEYIVERPEDLGTDSQMVYWSISQPIYMVKDVHSHNFHQFLCFLGTNSLDMNEFDAEVDVGIGEEGDIHVVKEPTIIRCPPGLPHCPLNFRKINKPIIFLEFMFNMGEGQQYSRNVLKKLE